MMNFKTYFGAITLILLTAQCSLFPWNPMQPEIEPEPVYLDEYYVAIGDTTIVQFEGKGSSGYMWNWINKESCSHVDSVGSDYEVINKDPLICGSPGIEYWKFEGKEIGVDTLEFIWCRYGKVDIIEKKSVIIHVGGQ